LADYTLISDQDWRTYLATPDKALRGIVMLEKLRQDIRFYNWADAIDLGHSLILQLQAQGEVADRLQLVVRQSLANALQRVGDYDGYIDQSLAMAKLARDHAFFSRKMDMVYDLALEAARENDAVLAEDLQRLHAGYVKKYNITDLVRWDENLCAHVESDVQNYPGVVRCLSESSLVTRGPVSPLDIEKLKMLIVAYAHTGDVTRAKSYLAMLNAAPKPIYPRHDILFETAVDAYLLHAQGQNAEAFAKLDQWSAGMKDHSENVRVSSMHNLYEALRKELDRKSAESELLTKQVQMSRWLTAASCVIALLLAALVAGGALWVVRIRRMQRRLTAAHDDAEAANEAKSRFLAVMSHELRTPLNGVLGMAQALHKEPLEPQQKEQIGVLVDSGKTLMALLNDVLDMSRIEAGKVELVPANGTMKQMIERVIHTYAAVAQEKGLGLHFDIAESATPPMMFDPLRVYQCLSNLVSNALKFTETGEVSIIATAERRHHGYRVHIEVRDTGIGMSRSTIDKLFEAYSQGDPTTARKYGGAGLGLSISRRLAELMGGGLSVTSEEGAGSSFLMTFEASEVMLDDLEVEDEVDDGAPEALAVPEMPRRKILLVDDHPVNRRVARLFLEPFNFAITEATNGQEALDADMSSFDLVLMDLNMPHMGGLEACRIFRASEAPGKHVPIVALTADAMKDQVEACNAAGMDAHISKPILMEKLIETVTSLLDGRDDAGTPLAKAS
jgi:signal transduction histidine kinase/CheY-like chemotaxis protein